MRLVSLGKYIKRVSIEISICLASQSSATSLIVRNGSNLSMFISYHQNVWCEFLGCTRFLICDCIGSQTHFICYKAQYQSGLCKAQIDEMRRLSLFSFAASPTKKQQNDSSPLFKSLKYTMRVRSWCSSWNEITQTHFSWASKVWFEIKLACLKVEWKTVDKEKITYEVKISKEIWTQFFLYLLNFQNFTEGYYYKKTYRLCFVLEGRTIDNFQRRT